MVNICNSCVDPEFCNLAGYCHHAYLLEQDEIEEGNDDMDDDLNDFPELTPFANF